MHPKSFVSNFWGAVQRCMGIFNYTNICVVLILELVTVVNQLGFAEHQVVEHSLVSTLANHL